MGRRCRCAASRAARPGPDELVANGTLTPELRELLATAVAERRSVLVSGGTGSGKTTLLNALSACDRPGRAGGDDRGRGRAAAAPAARGAPGEPPGVGRGPRRGDDPRPAAKRAADAPRPDRHRRGARRRGARPADRAQHRPRRRAVHRARQLARRRAAAHRDARADGRRRPSARCDSRAGGARHRPGRPHGSRPRRRRRVDRARRGTEAAAGRRRARGLARDERRARRSAVAARGGRRRSRGGGHSRAGVARRPARCDGSAARSSRFAAPGARAMCRPRLERLRLAVLGDAGVLACVALAVLGPGPAPLGRRRARRWRAGRSAGAAPLTAGRSSAGWPRSRGRSPTRCRPGARHAPRWPLRRARSRGRPRGEMARVARRARARHAPTRTRSWSCAARLDSPRVDSFAAAILSQRLAGGDLAVLLRRFAAASADRERTEADARSATAQARFTGLLVVAMPVAAALLAELLVTGFVGGPAREPGVGNAARASAAALQLAGFAAIRRLCRIEARRERRAGCDRRCSRSSPRDGSCSAASASS